MRAEELYRFRDSLTQQGVLFYYAGLVSETLLLGLGETLRQRLEAMPGGAAAGRSVFAVFVELTQNIIRYADADAPHKAPEGPAARPGVLVIGTDREHYFVAGGNVIDRAQEPHLRAVLDQIQDLNKEQLRALHKERLRAPPDPASQGAGLGLIEIARRATDRLEADFQPVDGEHSFFCLKAVI